jgi:menaquinone-dependent protoporphyrinogen oxidase
MRVLIAYASRYGATKGIAERIAATLSQQGVEATVVDAQRAADPAGYDAAIIGSASYYFH